MSSIPEEAQPLAWEDLDTWQSLYLVFLVKKQPVWPDQGLADLFVPVLDQADETLEFGGPRFNEVSL